jgi:hypothetical protein
MSELSLEQYVYYLKQRYKSRGLLKLQSFVKIQRFSENLFYGC